VQNVPPGVNVTWSVSPADRFAVDTGTGNSFATRATSSSTRGQGTVTATLAGACGDIELTQNVWMGKPLAQSQNYLIEICEFDEGYLNAVPHVENLEYEWHVNNTYYTSTNNQYLVWGMNLMLAVPTWSIYELEMNVDGVTGIMLLAT
jgi:hypothetical protein